MQARRRAARAAQLPHSFVFCPPVLQSARVALRGLETDLLAVQARTGSLGVPSAVPFATPAAPRRRASPRSATTCAPHKSSSPRSGLRGGTSGRRRSGGCARTGRARTRSAARRSSCSRRGLGVGRDGLGRLPLHPHSPLLIAAEARRRARRPAGRGPAPRLRRVADRRRAQLRRGGPARGPRARAGGPRSRAPATGGRCAASRGREGRRGGRDAAPRGGCCCDEGRGGALARGVGGAGGWRGGRC